MHSPPWLIIDGLQTTIIVAMHPSYAKRKTPLIAAFFIIADAAMQ
jgi:hypothetical protein